jgi:hypothetical protein
VVANPKERVRKENAFHAFDTDEDDDDFISVSELQAAWRNSDGSIFYKL